MNNRTKMAVAFSMSLVCSASVAYAGIARASNFRRVAAAGSCAIGGLGAQGSYNLVWEDGEAQNTGASNSVVFIECAFIDDSTTPKNNLYQLWVDTYQASGTTYIVSGEACYHDNTDNNGGCGNVTNRSGTGHNGLLIDTSTWNSIGTDDYTYLVVSVPGSTSRVYGWAAYTN